MPHGILDSEISTLMGSYGEKSLILNIIQMTPMFYVVRIGKYLPFGKV
jgi:hypothetical protein